MSRKALEVLAALAIAISALAITLDRSASNHSEQPKVESATGVPQTEQAPVEVAPRIDVVFAVDTTGSMGGLLETAKRKIWSIANQLASGQPTPEIRVGLVAFRDRGDEYIVSSTPLTADLDTVHEKLLALRAAGGGDSPEHVNMALKTAIEDFQWDRSERSLRMIFLVGDAPPHDDYQDGLNSAELANVARDQGLIINTIRCGNNHATELAWQAIAQRAGGEYTSIAQDGGLEVVHTPYDTELARLDADFNDTMLGFGGAKPKAASRRKVARRKALSADAAAAAASYAAKSGRVQSEDLIGYIESGKALESVADDELPDSLMGKERSEQKRILKKIRHQRKRLKGEIKNLAEKREAYLEEQRARSGGKSGFDGEVLQMLRKQAGKIAVDYTRD